MFKHQEKSASLDELQEWLDVIKRKLLGLRWDDTVSISMWEKDRRRVEKLIVKKSQPC